jgi:hypothetical protein
MASSRAGLIEPIARECDGKRVDVRPNWNEQPTMRMKLRYD